MTEWTDPRYAPAVEMLATMRATGPRDAKKRCKGCFGYRFRLFLAPGGGRSWIPCTRCGDSGEQPARPSRRRT